MLRAILDDLLNAVSKVVNGYNILLNCFTHMSSGVSNLSKVFQTENQLYAFRLNFIFGTS